MVVRSNAVTVGYWNDAKSTADALRDGWYHTGDLGYLNDRNYLFVVDRAKDMIVSGGENVYSVEVEDALYRHPAVAEAAVFGVPDERWGEAVHAIVVVHPGSVVGSDELRAHCRQTIAGYKVPKAIEISTNRCRSRARARSSSGCCAIATWPGRRTLRACCQHNRSDELVINRHERSSALPRWAG